MTATPKLLSEVEDAMASGSVTRRGTIVRHITDLFIVGSAQCSDQEIALFDDVLTRLAVEIEVSARALLAVRLAPIGNKAGFPPAKFPRHTPASWAGPV